MLRRNPLGRSPPSCWNGGCCIDSIVICEYLDGLGDTPRLFPPPARRGSSPAAPCARQRLRWISCCSGAASWAGRTRRAYPRKLRGEAAAVLATLEARRPRSRQPPDIGHVAIGCALSYLDFRWAEVSTGGSAHPALAAGTPASRPARGAATAHWMPEPRPSRACRPRQLGFDRRGERPCRPLRIGDVTITSIVERDGPWRTPEEMFPAYDPVVGERHLRELDPVVFDPASAAWSSPTRPLWFARRGTPSWSIPAPARTRATRRRWTFPKQPWLDGFAAAGLRFEDIDYVFCTHLHIDHCGWNTRLVNGRWVPTFPQGQIHLPQGRIRRLGGIDHARRQPAGQCLALQLRAGGRCRPGAAGR